MAPARSAEPSTVLEPQRCSSSEMSFWGGERGEGRGGRGGEGGEGRGEREGRGRGGIGSLGELMQDRELGVLYM